MFKRAISFTFQLILSPGAALGACHSVVMRLVGKERLL